MDRYEYASLRMTDNEQELRQMLALAYSGHNLYCDDGELQDNRCPMIDFMRDSVEEIHNKITERSVMVYKIAVEIVLDEDL